jgi:hypothetical protein
MTFNRWRTKDAVCRNFAGKVRRSAGKGGLAAEEKNKKIFLDSQQVAMLPT